MNKEKFIYAVINGDIEFNKEYKGEASSFYAEICYGIENRKEITRVRNLGKLIRCAGFAEIVNSQYLPKEMDLTEFKKKNIDEQQKILSKAQIQETVESFIKKCEGGQKIFVEWYYDKYFAKKEQGYDPRCEYCGVIEKECGLLKTKRGATRSKHLEIERIRPNDAYNKDNCILACYVCNNAKSDFMSEDEFKKLIPGIQAFWESQRKKKN